MTQPIEVEPAWTAVSEHSLSFAIRIGTPNAPSSEAITRISNQGWFFLAAGDVSSREGFEETFDRLATQWRDETGTYSSISKKVRHPALFIPDQALIIVSG